LQKIRDKTPKYGGVPAMIVLLDTSSLLSLVRYYLPFDNQDKLLNYFKQRIIAKEIVILETVYKESKLVVCGIIVERLDFLNDKKLRTKTDDLLPDKKYFNRVENEFCYGARKNSLTPSEFESRKKAFLESADSKLLLYCLQHKDEIDSANYVIVTEETVSSNDNKAFKKLPAICDTLEIKHSTLPELMGTFNDFTIEFL